MRSKKVIALLISLTLLVSIAIPGTLALSTDQTSSNGTIEVPTETTTPAPEAQQEQEGQNEQENICTCGGTDGTVPETTVPETGTAASEQPEAPMEQKPVSTDERYTVSFDLGGGILTARGVDRSVTAAPGETITLPGAPENAPGAGGKHGAGEQQHPERDGLCGGGRFRDGAGKRGIRREYGPRRRRRGGPERAGGGYQLPG